LGVCELFEDFVPGLSAPVACSIRFLAEGVKSVICAWFVCVDCLQVKVGIIIESSDQKTRVFVVQIAPPR
jgi:hypothetical protein